MHFVKSQFALVVANLHTKCAVLPTLKWLGGIRVLAHNNNRVITCCTLLANRKLVVVYIYINICVLTANESNFTFNQQCAGNDGRHVRHNVCAAKRTGLYVWCSKIAFIPSPKLHLQKYTSYMTRAVYTLFGRTQPAAIMLIVTITTTVDRQTAHMEFTEYMMCISHHRTTTTYENCLKLNGIMRRFFLYTPV